MKTVCWVHNARWVLLMPRCRKVVHHVLFAYWNALIWGFQSWGTPFRTSTHVTMSTPFSLSLYQRKVKREWWNSSQKIVGERNMISRGLTRGKSKFFELSKHLAKCSMTPSISGLLMGGIWSNSRADTGEYMIDIRDSLTLIRHVISVICLVLTIVPCKSSPFDLHQS